MGWWFLRLWAKILALLRLPVNLFQLKKTQKQTRRRPIEGRWDFHL